MPGRKSPRRPPAPSSAPAPVSRPGFRTPPKPRPEQRARTAPRPQQPMAGAPAKPGKTKPSGKTNPSDKAKPSAMPAAITPPAPRSGDEGMTLAQFIKAAQLADSGGQAKHLVRAGGILVNGVEELRPGRQLRPGDVIQVAGEDYQIDA